MVFFWDLHGTLNYSCKAWVDKQIIFIILSTHDWNIESAAPGDPDYNVLWRQKTPEPWPTCYDVPLAYSVYPNLMFPLLPPFFILSLVAIWFNFRSGGVCLCQVECAWRVFVPVWKCQPAECLSHDRAYLMQDKFAWLICVRVCQGSGANARMAILAVYKIKWWVASVPAVIVCVVLQHRLVSNSMSCWPKRLSLVPIHTSIPQISATEPRQFTQNCFMGTLLCIYLLCVIAHSVSLPLGPMGLLPSSTEAGSLMAVCFFHGVFGARTIILDGL